MAISFDKAFGIHQYTIGARAARAEVLSANIANADTPGYKAKDLDFSAALQQAQSGIESGFSLATSNERHISSTISSGLTSSIKYRNPDQPDTGDGNSVDVQRERSAFLENGLEYQASLEFLNSRISGLLKAIKGDQA
ncbi:MAG: flagellar basal body rod protein FlgB [Aeromonadaceae bacterium]|nr:flagellar basal body rod protein FlgB [Aeromonadaceae bacterium]